MSKKPSILDRLKSLYASNPAMFWAVGWVTTIPSIFSLLTLRFLYSNQTFFDHIQSLNPGVVLIYLVTTSLLMGLALLPTTFLAVLSGFVLGWVYFPFLVLGYSLASIMGYLIGRKLDKDSLVFLLKNYPKAAQLIADKKDNMSQLIFFVRLSPVIPFALSNLLFALLKVELKKVVWMGLWGMLPRTLVAFTTGVLGESLMNALQERDGTGQLIIIIVLLLVSGWGIYRFFRKR